MTAEAPDLLDLLASEPSPLAWDETNAIREAIATTAAELATFSIADIRPNIPESVRTSKHGAHRIGAVMSAMVKRGELVRVGIAESGNAAQRNAHRIVPSYRLAVA